VLRGKTSSTTKGSNSPQLAHALTHKALSNVKKETVALCPSNTKGGSANRNSQYEAFHQ
jgi:hypothetical protein